MPAHPRQGRGRLRLLALRRPCRHCGVRQRRRPAHLYQLRSERRPRAGRQADARLVQQRGQDHRMADRARRGRQAARVRDHPALEHHDAGRQRRSGERPGAGGDPACRRAASAMSAMSTAAPMPNANDLARQIADQHARAFKCGADKPIVLGARARASAGHTAATARVLTFAACRDEASRPAHHKQKARPSRASRTPGRDVQSFQANATLSRLRRRTARRSAPPPCRRARDRTPPPDRCPTAPTSPGSSARSGRGRGAPR